jgi:acyl-CoA thioesterase
MIEDDPASMALGLRRVESAPGAVFEMTVRPDHANLLGSTHGGVVFSLAERAMALTADGAVTVDAHLVLTGVSRPGDVLRALVEPATSGRTLSSYRVTVTRDDGRIVGVVTGATLER